MLVGAVNKPPKPTKHGLTPFPTASGTGQSATFTATGSGTGVLTYTLKFKEAGAPPTWTKTVTKAINVIFVPVELITPAGDSVNAPVDGGDGSGTVPDGANEFTYSTASTGVLTLKLKAKVLGIGSMGPAIQGRFKFEVDTIGGSTLGWNYANFGGAVTANGDFLTAIVTFTGLPQNNSDFGSRPKGSGRYIDTKR